MDDPYNFVYLQERLRHQAQVFSEPVQPIISCGTPNVRIKAKIYEIDYIC